MDFLLLLYHFSLLLGVFVWWCCSLKKLKEICIILYAVLLGLLFIYLFTWWYTREHIFECVEALFRMTALILVLKASWITSEYITPHILIYYFWTCACHWLILDIIDGHWGSLFDLICFRWSLKQGEIIIWLWIINMNFPLANIFCFFVCDKTYSLLLIMLFIIALQFLL